MKNTPNQAVASFVSALTSGDVELALTHYAVDAVFVTEPGKTISGHHDIRQALCGFVAARAVIDTTSHASLENGNTALYQSNWTMSGVTPDGSPLHLEGTSSDVLQRQADGTWLIVIDNPWGSLHLAAA